MKCEENLSFASELLARLNVATHIIREPDVSMSSEVDGGLRAMLFGEKDYAKLLVSSPSEAEERVIYRFFDEYRCNYIFFQIPDALYKEYFYVGPYLPKLPSETFITKKSEQLSLSEEKSVQFRSYYRNLPVIEEENIIFSIVDTLGNNIFGGEENFEVKSISYEIPDKLRPVYRSGVFEGLEDIESQVTLEMIEEIYENEGKLMDAISKGNLSAIDFIASSVLNRGTQERISDSLRNRKNYLIIFNTILRKAAENGEVHPYHIHILSSAIAMKIESIRSIEESLDLQKEMMLKYCMLVKEFSLKKYSRLVGRVITMISYDLTADLSLSHISDTLNINASYLSALFKKECGETLTDYVNRKRLEAAAFALSHTDRQIQTISEECGILDVNYFIKLFKKKYGQTPLQYRKNHIR